MWLTILLSCGFYVLGVGGCVLLRKRPALLVIVAAVFLALSLPTFRTVNGLLN